MGVLWYRLLRAIRETAGQFIAMATIVALGVCSFYGMHLALDRLILSKQSFYAETKAADYYFHIQRAPIAIIKEIEALPGVAQATGRIQEDIKIVVDGRPYRSGRIISFESNGYLPVNGFKVLTGSAPDGADLQAEAGIKAYVDSQYFSANALAVGDRMDIVAKKRFTTVTVAGAVSSPDYLFKMRSNRDFPDRRDFVVLYTPRRSAEKLLDMEREVNQILIRFSSGANELLVRDRIKEILTPYGLVAGYAQQEQPSAKNVASQLDGLQSSSAILPVGFFIAAIGIMYVLLHRYITMQHVQIGIMKAIGCTNQMVMGYYTGYALAVTLTGALIGLVAGSVLGSVSFMTFAELLSLPEQYQVSGQFLIAVSIIASVATGLTAGLLASRSVASIDPALAMSSSAALSIHNSGTAICGRRWRFGSSWNMTLRSVSRNRVRFLVTGVGLTMTVGMLIIALYFLDSRHYLLYRFFSVENRYDYAINLHSVFTTGDVRYLQNWEGIRNAEPMLELAVSFSPLQATGTDRDPKDGVILGVNPEGFEVQAFYEDERPAAIPAEGVLLNAKVAETIGVRVGDMVEIKTNPLQGDSYRDTFLVRGIVKQNLGSVSFMSLGTAQRLSHEKDGVNTVLLQTDRKVMKELETRLLEIPEVSHLQSKARQREIFEQLVGIMTYFTFIMVAIAGLLGGTIVYLTSMINFNERRRELACLRIIGWSMGDVASLLFNEIKLAMGLAIICGFPLGKYAGAAFLKAASNETFTWPIIVYPATYLLAAVLTILFAVLGHLMAVIRIRKLPLVEVLNSRE